MRLGTRGSALALAQARLVADLLGGAEIVEVETSGDRGATGDKARFVKELEEALLAGEVDLAVHSAKDVPAALPEGLALVGVPDRADARDEARVEALAKAVVKRILHEPTERVRALDDEHRHARLKLLRELFGLEEDAASEAGEAAEVRRLAG